ncbi:MAG: hypothetical protein L3J89_08475 [Gammaproteobacteria bacterium]|nr:hypothetical protein [Gammaproteobacteria bacterium]
MASIYNKIHRLKQQPGWDWQHFQDEIDSVDPDGISLKLLLNYYRKPHKKPTLHVIQIIEFLHGECFPGPFPVELDRLMHIYRELRMSRRFLTKEKDTQDLGRHAEQILATSKETDNLGKACLHWLLGNIEFDRIAAHAERHDKDKAEISKQAALLHYQAVLDALAQHNCSHPENVVNEQHIYRAHYNMVACYLNAIPEDAYSSHDVASLQYVRESGYLEHCRRAITAEPFQWSIARNGLRFSSLLEDKNEVKRFFSLLIAIYPRFVDLSYEPYNQLAISVMEDYQWAIKNVLTPAYLSQQRKALKAQARDDQAA